MLFAVTILSLIRVGQLADSAFGLLPVRVVALLLALYYCRALFRRDTRIQRAKHIAAQSTACGAMPVVDKKNN
jgi:hypothetical protein